MTPRQRVEALLRGEDADKVPFTIYERKLPQCTVERKLRNEGLCIVNRKFPVIKTSSPNVKQKTSDYTENGELYQKSVIKTPEGELSRIVKPAGFTSWQITKLFKNPEDYKPLLFMIKDQQFEPHYEAFAAAEKFLGEDFILRAGIHPNPLHQIMIQWMGVEIFAVEWAERRDEIEKLYNAQVENLRKIYPIVAKSPALHANFGGNETGNVMGRERFQKYVVPLYNEAGEIFHKHGKFLGTHLDGNNKIWADMVADSELDYIEAFTPAPDTDMTFKEAKEIWKDKLLWINFPSSLHLASLEKIEETTKQIITDSLPEKRLIIGITEDIPEDRWQNTLQAISRGINDFKY
jgi:hypothetical protein